MRGDAYCFCCGASDGDWRLLGGLFDSTTTLADGSMTMERDAGARCFYKKKTRLEAEGVHFNLHVEKR